MCDIYETEQDRRHEREPLSSPNTLQTMEGRKKREGLWGQREVLILGEMGYGASTSSILVQHNNTQVLLTAEKRKRNFNSFLVPFGRLVRINFSHRCELPRLVFDNVQGEKRKENRQCRCNLLLATVYARISIQRHGPKPFRPLFPISTSISPHSLISP